MAQLVEHHLAKVRVAGSNPVVRSIVLDELVGKPTSSLEDKTPGWRRGQVVRQRPAKPSPPVRIRASPPKNSKAAYSGFFISGAFSSRVLIQKTLLFDCVNHFDIGWQPIN